MPETTPTPTPEMPTKLSFAQLRQAFQNVGIVVTKRSMRSYDYVAGVSGWKIDANGDVEFNDGTFRGTLAAGSIYIPNASNPAFSVDTSGNVIANSLRRKDFHWFTIFESVDGYSKTADGTGSFILNPSSLDSLTGTVSGNTNVLQKIVRNAGTTAFTWNKSKSAKYSIMIDTDVNDHVCNIGNGDLSTTTDRHIGFRITNGAVLGIAADGTTESTVSLGSISNNFIYILEYYHDVAAGSIKYYINGTLLGTITTNIPTGSGSADRLLEWRWRTNAASAKAMHISFWDLWQAN